MRNRQVVEAWLSLCFLTVIACQGGPVGWGGTYKILRADFAYVVIEYDSLVVGLDSVARAAQEEAQARGGVAVLEDDSGVRANGLFRWARFRIGRPYQIVHATTSQLTIEYDTALTDYRSVIQVAEDYARQRGLEAVFEKEGPSRAADQVKTVIFRLE